VASKTQSAPAAPTQAPEGRAPFKALVDLLASVPFPAALLTLDISARLRNCLQATEKSDLSLDDVSVPHRDLGGVLADWPRVRRNLMKQKNLGRSTVQELEEIVKRIVSAKLRIGSETDDGPVIGEIEELTEERLDKALYQKVVAAQEFEETNGVGSISWQADGADRNLVLLPSEQIDEIVGSLPRKEHETIVRRYGFDNREPETLEEIGVQFHVSRERVRQVEAKALARLRIGTNRAAFQRLLETESGAVWDQLSDGKDIILPSDIQDRRASISKQFMLAVDVIHGRLQDWINTQGQVALGGWVSRGADPLEIKSRLGRLSAWAESAPGPVPVAVPSEATGVPEGEFGIAERFRPEFRLFEGYFVPGHLGPQAKRTCRLHKLSLKSGDYKPFDVCTLQNAYAAAYPEDDISPRVVNLQLQRAPHLFFRLFDSIWLTICSQEELPEGGYLDEIPFARQSMPGGMDFEPGSIGAWLYTTLAKNGASRMVDLREQADAELPQDISQSSVGAILQSNPDFVRIAPGVYGLQRDVATWSGQRCDIAPSLLSDTQCRYYGISRKAGDPQDIFPAWNCHFEMALCRWAFSNASEDNYRTLLSAVSPAGWPIEPGEVATWEDRKRVYGTYRIPMLSFPEGIALPSASDFLASLIYMFATGSIGWTTVNRVSQRRVDSFKAAATIALLVRFGLASPQQHWQSRHWPTRRVRGILSSIFKDLLATGVLSWDKRTLCDLRMEPPVHYDVNYAPEETQTILNGGNGSADNGRMMGARPTQDLESLFGSDDWGAIFKSD
jgi:hypothetical protein